jgi:ubiquinone/menaquinone biosynthesis C-methylase UbiE
MRLLKKLKARLFASQLRKPGFLFGKKTGLQMNAANEFLYDFTLNTMQLKEGESLLEIGFGNGKFFKKIFSKSKNLKVTGIDYSAEMLREARKKNQYMINNGSLYLLKASSSSMPLDSESFDKIFCINVIYFWDDPAEHLAEVYRVLKPGGKFYTVIRSKEMMSKAPFTKYGFTFYSEAEWLSILVSAGFNNMVTHIINEPTVNHKGKEYTLQSYCFESLK